MAVGVYAYAKTTQASKYYEVVKILWIVSTYLFHKLQKALKFNSAPNVLWSTNLPAFAPTINRMAPVNK